MIAIPRYIRLFLLLPLAWSLSGCSRPVGGPCEYESRIGIARVVAEKEGEILVNFDPLASPFTTGFVPFSATSRLAVAKQPIDGMGSIYPARLEIMTKGSCTPYRLNLLATRHTHRPIFLEFDPAGQVLPETAQQIQQIASIFDELRTLWPQLRLRLCGRSSPAVSPKEISDIARQYANTVARKLELSGIPTERINTIAVAESSCPDSHGMSDAANGVWLCFQLTAKTVPTTVDRDIRKHGSEP